MNKKDELELFYILPYTKSYNSGGYYRSDETCSIAYRSPSKSIWNKEPLVFDKKEELLNWFYQNSDNPIPIVYRIKYIANYLGVDDVIKITNLKDNKTEYYTALSEDSYAKYDASKSELYDKNVWEECYSFRYDDKALFRFEYIYNEFIKRGIKIKFNVYKKVVDEKERFEFIGDLLSKKDRKEAEGKKLVLYRSNPINWW